MGFHGLRPQGSQVRQAGKFIKVMFGVGCKCQIIDIGFLVMKKEEEKTFKMIIIGPPGVGKSCLLNRFTKDEYRQGYTATLGVEFYSKQIKIDEQSSVKMQIWDTAGMESFRSIIKTFYRSSAAVFLVYNIANLASFEELEHWYTEAIENCTQDAIFALIGAQKDREFEQLTSGGFGEGGEVHAGQRFGVYVRDFGQDQRERGDCVSGGSQADNIQKDKQPDRQEGQKNRPKQSPSQKMRVLIVYQICLCALSQQSYQSQQPLSLAQHPSNICDCLCNQSNSVYFKLTMSQHLKIPFHNQLLLQCLQTKVAMDKPTEHDQKRVQQSDYSTQQSLSYSLGGQSCHRNLTQLSYSIQNQENNVLDSAAKPDGNGQYLTFYHDEAKMHSLLTFHPAASRINTDQGEQDRDDANNCDFTPMVGKDLAGYFENNGEQKFDYSQELHSLKSKLAEIQAIAQLEIVRLKQQLAQQKQLRFNNQRSKAVVRRDVGVNTQRDCRDEEIEVLKNSVLGHIDLNRKLLQKQVKKGSCQMQNLINKVQMR